MHNHQHGPNVDYSDHFLEMAFRTDLRKRPATASGYGKHNRECGDALEVFLDIHNNVITKVQYYSSGCFSANACGNALAEVAAGKSVDDAWNITARDLADFLETLPDHEFHCAEMAVKAFALALTDYSQLKRKPWEKDYRVL